MRPAPLAISLWQIAATFASLSLVAIGGANAIMPDIHRRIVDVLGWMNDTTFANLFAIAQTAPGPNVLIVSLIGWHVAGFAGLAVATLAMIVPSSLLAFGAGRLMARFARLRAIAAAQRGLVPITVGLILASGVVMGRAADHGALTLAATLGTALYVFASDWNPLWALAAAAAASLLGSWLGIAG
ncbi:MAG TPA: chromate transporter [Alphaproteobacteria bacterium]|nr:chromate transporter [Alphaproteobacteria bacterium]